MILINLFSRSLICSSASVILLLIPSSVLFICLFVLYFSMSLVIILCIFSVFIPLLFWDLGSSSLSLFWISFLEGCLSPFHLAVFFWSFILSLYLNKTLCFFTLVIKTTFCDVVLVLATEGLWLFLFVLSAFWQKRIRGLYKLHDGRDWWREKLGPALVGRTILSKTLIQLPTNGLLVVWPEAT